MCGMHSQRTQFLGSSDKTLQFTDMLYSKPMCYSELIEQCLRNPLLTVVSSETMS